MNGRPESGLTAAEAVLSRAASCRTWSQLAEAARLCTACPDLVVNRSSVVVGDAPHGCRLVLIGEAPGAEEDISGRPFVGRSGRLLDELLDGAGLDRGEIAVLNVVKCRPPRNRTPRSAETRNCSGWLNRQLDLLGAELICTLGLSATQHLLGRGLRLATARGRVHQAPAGRVVVTYHPSAALRFGPRGAPREALATDLGMIADLLAAR